MRIGILEAGSPPPDLKDRFGGYDAMSSDLLGEDFACRAYKVREGDLPKSADECDGWLITGSAAGVYDPEPWIADLKGFVQAAAGRAPMIGICFGHQLMAEAFGGRVVKSPKGWGIGLHRYDIARQADFMDSDAAVALPASHQDQVVAVGDGAEVLGGSAFTPFGLLAYPGLRAVSIQPHPEFDPAYAAALVAGRRGTRFSAELADDALATLAGPNDRERVAGWLKRFLKAG